MFPVTIDNSPKSHCLIPVSYWHWEHGNMIHWIIGPLAIGAQLLSAFEVPAPEGDGERRRHTRVPVIPGTLVDRDFKIAKEHSNIAHGSWLMASHGANLRGCAYALMRPYAALGPRT